MSLPKLGDSVKVTLKNGETIDGVIDWIDGNGAWVKNPQKSRWVPIESLAPSASAPALHQEAGKEPSEE